MKKVCGYPPRMLGQPRTSAQICGRPPSSTVNDAASVTMAPSALVRTTSQTPGGVWARSNAAMRMRPSVVTVTPVPRRTPWPGHDSVTVAPLWKLDPKTVAVTVPLLPPRLGTMPEIERLDWELSGSFVTKPKPFLQAELGAQSGPPGTP